jgi:hypothetical protein
MFLEDSLNVTRKLSKRRVEILCALSFLGVFFTKFNIDISLTYFKIAIYRNWHTFVAYITKIS